MNGNDDLLLLSLNFVFTNELLPEIYASLL